MLKSKKEILSSCCAFVTDGSVEVHVLESDCPIKRKQGRRSIQKLSGEEKTECTCIYRSSTYGNVIPPCEFYKGIKKVTRNKRREFQVQCTALKQDTAPKKWDEKIYAFYKGEEFITEGTIPEIHSETGKTIDYLRYMTYPIYEKRCGNSTKRQRLILLEDEEG